MEGLVIKNISNIYTVNSKGCFFDCLGSGKVKQDGKILVGDKVIFDDLGSGKGVITQVCARANSFCRPPVANIKNLLIVISPIPEPDYYLVDKLVIFCLINRIKPIICVNKDDIVTDEFKSSIISQYKDVVKNIVFVSAKTRAGLDSLCKLLKNKITSLVGQSAVGKSSIANALLGTSIIVGDVSTKTGRGKQTTRHTELYVNGDILLIDTAGFSSLDIELSYENLALLYPDISKYVGRCKYHMCSHTNEGTKDCFVKQMVACGKIDKNRYDRYVKLYRELKDGKPQKINMKNATRRK